MAWKISDLHMGCDSWRSIEPGDVWFPGYPMAFHQQPTPDSALPDPTLDHHKVKAGGWGTLENHHSSYSMIPNMVKHGKNGTNKQIIIRYWVDSAIDNRTYENSCLLGTETWPSNVIRIRSVTSDAHHLQYPYDAPISMEKIQQNPNEIHGVRPDSAECMPRSAPGLSPHCDSAALSAWPRWKYWAWPLDLWGWVWIGSEGLPQHGKFFLGSSTQTHLDHLKTCQKTRHQVFIVGFDHRVFYWKGIRTQAFHPPSMPAETLEMRPRRYRSYLECRHWYWPIELSIETP